MSDNTVVRLKPKIRPRPRYKLRLMERAMKKRVSPISMFGLEHIQCAPVVAFVAGVAGMLLCGVDWRERRKIRYLLMILLMMAGVLMVLMGSLRLAIMQLHH